LMTRTAISPRLAISILVNMVLSLFLWRQVSVPDACVSQFIV